METGNSFIDHTTYITIKEVAIYLNVKEKTLYALAASGDIPHYRIGRLIRFKKDEIDAWMQTRKVVKGNSDQTAQKILRTIQKSSAINIQRVVKKNIDEIKAASYSAGHGKSDRIEGLRKEAKHGII